MRALRTVAALVTAVNAIVSAQAPRRALAVADVDVIAQLVMLEDTRVFDEAVLSSALRSEHPEVRRRAALDTGRPGYTLGSTPQPHNEGDFTALGRVVGGMDVVDRLELGDAVTAARVIRP